MHASNSVELLHIEDSRAESLLIREALSDCATDFQVTHLGSGEEALEFFRRVTDDGQPIPDLVILDVNLPDVSGYEVLRFLKDQSKLSSIPVIVVSGLVYADSLLGDYRSSIEQLLSKPEDGDGYRELADEIEQTWLKSRDNSQAD